MGLHLGFIGRKIDQFLPGNQSFLHPNDRPQPRPTGTIDIINRATGGSPIQRAQAARGSAGIYVNPLTAAVNVPIQMVKNTAQLGANAAAAPIESGISLFEKDPIKRAAIQADAARRSPIARAGQPLARALSGEDVGHNLLRSAGSTVDTITTATPLVGFGKRQAGEAAGKAIIRSGLQNAAYGSVANASHTAANTGNVKETLKAGATGAGVGLVLGAGFEGAGQGVVRAAKSPHVQNEAGGVPLPNISFKRGKAPVAVKQIEQAGERIAKENKVAVKSDLGLRERARRAVGGIGDDTSFALRVDRIAKKLSGKDLPSLKLDNAIQAAQDAVGATKVRLHENGFNQLVQDIAGTKGVTLNGYDAYAKSVHGLERAAALQKKGEGLESAYNDVVGKATGISFADAQKFAQEGQNTYGGFLARHTAISKAEVARRVAQGRLTPEAGAAIDRFETYVPLNRHFSEDMKNSFSRQTSVGSSTADPKRVVGRSSREIQNVLESTRQQIQRSTEKELSNNAATIVADHIAGLPGNPFKIKAVRTAEDVAGRQAIWKELADSKPVKLKLTRMLRTANRNSKAIETELNALNKKGLHLSLKSDPRPDAVEGKVVDTLAETGKISSVQVRQLIKGLINHDPAGLKAIRSQIKTRDSKLAALLDDASSIGDALNAVKQERTMLHNDAMRMLDKDKTGENYITRMKNGINEQYTVGDPHLHELLTAPKHSLNKGMRVIAAPVRVQRAGITGALNPKFQAVMAATKDPFTRFLNAKYGTRNLSPINVVKGIFDMTAETVGHPTKFTQELKRGGGTRSLRVEQFRNPTTESIDSIASQRNHAARTAYLAMHPAEALTDIENKLSYFERVGRSIAARARYAGETSWVRGGKKLSHDEAIIAAKQSYREDSVNFARSSTWLQNSSVFFQLLNAQFQGGRRFGRNFLDAPAKTTGKLAVLATPVAVAAIYNNATPERAQMYSEIPEYERDSNTIIIPPWATRDDKGHFEYWKLPDAPDLKAYYGGIRKAVTGKYQEDPASFYDVGARAVAQFTGISLMTRGDAISQFVPAGVKGILEDTTNKNLFTGKEIVPEDADFRKKKEGYTSGTSQWLGQKLGVSPLRVQNFMDSTFGPGSEYAAGSLDKVLASIGTIDDTQVSDKSLLGDLKRTFYNPTGGKSDGLKAFEDIQKVGSEIQAPDDKKTYEAIHAKDPNPGVFDSPEKAAIYINRPAVLAADAKLNQANIDRGQQGNPFFKLSPSEQRTVLNIRVGRYLPGQTYDKNGNTLFADSNANSFYNQYQKDESTWFKSLGLTDDQIKKSQSPGIVDGKRPEFDQAILDAYNALPKGTGARSGFLKANPALVKYFQDSAAFTNSQRAAVGLAAVDTSSSSNGGFSKFSRGGGGSSSSQIRYSAKLARTPFKKATKAKVAIKKGSKATGGKVALKKGKTKVSIRKSLV